MNILLVNPPIRLTIPAYFQPFGMAVIAQVLLDAGHNVEIYDINSTRHTLEEVTEHLPRDKYDIIGTGGLITVYKYLLYLVPLLRKIYKDTPIVIGGGGLTSAPEVFMENLRPDYGVIGEGEYTMLELVNGLDQKDILGLAYFENGTLKINPPRPLEKNLDNFPMQAYHLLDMHKYAEVLRHNLEVKRELGTLATRGCPHACAFCYHIFGRSMRYRSADNVLDEIELLIDRYGVESIMFLDELFAAKKSYIYEFCHKIMKRKLNVAWSCYSRVDSVDEETMKLMAWAGCFCIGFGIESGSQKILDEMNKGVTVEQASESLRIARKYFRRVSTTLIYGMPGETKKTLLETKGWCRENLVFLDHLFHLNIYPNTKLYIENLDKILKKFGSEHEYFQVLGDTIDYVLNVTELSDQQYFEYLAEERMELRIQHLMQIHKVKLDANVPKEYIDGDAIYVIHPRSISHGKG